MKTTLAVMALMLAMILSAPVMRAQENDASMDPAVIARDSAPVQTIAPADVLKMMQDNTAKFALVDTQPVDGYADGHIPGALNYPWVMQIKHFPISLPRDRTLIFYGSCPHDTDDIVSKLAEFGYTNVKIMDGGWYKWLELKYPSTGTGNDSAPSLEVSQVTGGADKTAKSTTR
jgi:rhodanese-related sulfurtransferase